MRIVLPRCNSAFTQHEWRVRYFSESTPGIQWRIAVEEASDVLCRQTILSSGESLENL